MNNGLSSRGRRLLANPPFPEYLDEHFTRSASVYDQAANPDGYIPLSVAENLQMGESLLSRLSAVRPVPEQVLEYDSMVGTERFRAQLAQFLGRTILGRRFTVEQISVLAGAGSVLENLFYNLCDPGDGVLVPTPSYAGFWADLETRDEVVIVPVHTESTEDFQLTAEHLDQAVAAAGRSVKVLLLTSPNNPLGTVYSRPELEEIFDWARRTGIHVVCDEIYALSVYGDRPFTSCAELGTALGDDVHIVWAFSKDFGASGLRCGVLVSENEDLHRAVDALAYWACVSGHTQYLLGEAISDDVWVDEYITQMQAGLKSTYYKVTDELERQGIPYLPAGAGFFLLLDLRQFLAQPTWEAESVLWRRALDEKNVNLTPGSALHNLEPGFLRLCFASLPTQVVIEGVRRLGSMVNP